MGFPEHFEELRVGNLSRVIRYLARLGVPRCSLANFLVARICNRAAGVSGDYRLHAFDILKDRLDAPETSGCKCCGI